MPFYDLMHNINPFESKIFYECEGRKYARNNSAVNIVRKDVKVTNDENEN